MVEIVERPKAKKWKVKCEHCGCTLKFEKDDVKFIVEPYGAWDGKGSKKKEYVICPNCKKAVITLIEYRTEYDDWEDDYRSPEFYE